MKSPDIPDGKESKERKASKVGQVCQGKEKKKRGAPRREFDQKIADKICSLIIDGKSLRRICAMKAMPSKPTVLKWLAETPSFATQYAHARDAAGDTYADYITDLVEKANAANFNAIRVKIDALKWIAAKLKPKKYGDRLELQADVTVSTPAGRLDSKPLAEWTAQDRILWGQSRCFFLATMAKDLKRMGLDGFSDGIAYLVDQIWRRLVEGVLTPTEQARPRLPAKIERELNPRDPALSGKGEKPAVQSEEGHAQAAESETGMKQARPVAPMFVPSRHESGTE
jgi:hypothetical protein